jgi:hypothetical protein
MSIGGVTNHIGAPGRQGFGVGVCPSLPQAFAPMSGATDQASDNYGNYRYSDGSVMVWMPAFYLRIGHASNPTYAVHGINSVDIQPLAAFASDAAAELDGYYRHRAFINGGANQAGVMVDKYQPSNNGGVASSLPLGMPLVSAAATGNSTFSALDGAPVNTYYGAFAAAKTRGSRFFVTPIYVYDAIAKLALAHAQAATSAAWCAWYDATGVKNYPKGNNNSALKDGDDATVTYIAAGASGTPVLGKTGSTSPFAKTTHNGQACGIADINGNVWEIAPGITCIAATKTITGIALTNPLRLTIAAHGYATGAIAMTTGVGGTTQINDRMYKLTVVDANTISLDGCDGTAFSAFTAGGTCAIGTFYSLKASVNIAAVTAGNTLATDHWGAVGVAAQFDVIAPNFALTHGSNGLSQKYGNAANGVFVMDTAANRALSMLGLPANNGMSAAGTNLCGTDLYYQFVRNELCALAGGSWGSWSGAGVLARNLGTARDNASNDVGFRSASYL